MSQSLVSDSNGTLDSFILDAEVVAIDPHTNALRTFQELSNRPRKDVSLEDVKVVVCVYAFDLMYLDGEVCRILVVARALTGLGRAAAIG
jgi:ATP-dependent DNA ligase